jgi:phosphatidylinositol glycan class B
MNAILDGTRYEECWRGFNTHWHDDGRRRGDVVVRCLRQ